jgi:perosamine synthetase
MTNKREMIPVFRPSYGREEIETVSQVLESGWIGLGPETAKFEKQFASYVGSRYAVALNSGTAALHLALMQANTPATPKDT